MSGCYLDTSALVKRYFPEIGSVWVGTITDPSSGHTIVTAEIAQVEAAAAIAARQILLLASIDRPMQAS